MGKVRSFELAGAKRAGKKVASTKPGRYISSSPSGAAKKMLTQLCRQKKITGVCVFVVTLRETTMGGKGKEYTYAVRRTRLPKPVVLQGRAILYGTSAKAVKAKKPAAKKPKPKAKAKKPKAKAKKPKAKAKAKAKKAKAKK